MTDTKIGVVTHYYNHLGVGIIKLTGKLNQGDMIKFVGNGRDFSQSANSLQLDHKEIQSAKKGEEIGLKTDQKVREGDQVYKVTG